MIAQMQAASPDQVLVWLGGLLAMVYAVGLVLNALVAWKKFTTPSPKHEDQYVTHAQFDAFKNEMSAQMYRIGLSQQTMTADIAWMKGMMEGRSQRSNDEA